MIIVLTRININLVEIQFEVLNRVVESVRTGKLNLQTIRVKPTRRGVSRSSLCKGVIRKLKTCFGTAELNWQII